MVTVVAFSPNEIDFYKIQYNIYIYLSKHRGDVGEAPLIFTPYNAPVRMINEKTSGLT